MFLAAQKKYYAVKVGRKTGIFNSWAKCKEQIFAFSGAVYKSFETLEAAKNYLDISDKKTDKTKKDGTDKTIERIKLNILFFINTTHF